MERDFYVYILFKGDGQPFYVGKGKAYRWMKHEIEARSKPNRKSHKLSIIRQMFSQGWSEIPKVKVAEGLTHHQAIEIEVALIAAIGRGENGPLANHTDGGDGAFGWNHTPETLAKISRPRSEEAKANMRAAQALQRKEKQRRVVSAEQRAKQSATLKGRRLSPEHCASISAGLKGKKFGLQRCSNISAALSGKRRAPWSAQRKALHPEPIECICDGCEKVFLKPAWKPTYTRTYCSRECSMASQRGKPWPTQRIADFRKVERSAKGQFVPGAAKRRAEAIMADLGVAA